MHRIRKSTLFCGMAAALAISPATAQEGGHPAMGTVAFDVSCAEDVRPDFDRAVALLHHMQYVESRRTFESIAERAPSCAMAHWGIAMTLFHPLWPDRPSPDALQRGWDETQRARSLAPGTERERALLAAAEAFYRDPETADYWTRIARWAEGMERAYEQRPDDIETAAFYALSRLAAGQTAEDRLEYQARAAEVLLGVYAQRPAHPGAVHYTIHADDFEGREDESLDIVRSYDDIAPQVPHALHMPTHIFIRLGEWPETIMWNRRSADAALEFPAGDHVSLHHAHALDYMVYAHLQRGDDERALAVLREADENATSYQPGFASAFHLAAMPARYAIERQAWDEAAAIDPHAVASVEWDRFPWPQSISWFARGLGAIRTGDVQEAGRAEAEMAELRDAAQAAGERAFADYIEIDRRILAARLSVARGDMESAIELARSAGKLEGTVQKHPITPGALLPAYEALGDILAEAERWDEAFGAYERSLAVWPRRFNSLLGAARAARAMGDDREADHYYARLIETVGEASSTRPGLAEARAFASSSR
ncbi:MAG: hypothetical protein MJB57_05050 [Gemmatimonadetes bacterium]|nr:hypothetical protein [Gemmatimonadota bacterium]